MRTCLSMAVWVVLLVLSGFSGARTPVPVLQQLADRMGQRLEETLQREHVDEPVVALVVDGDATVLGRKGRITQELERLLLFRMEANLAVKRVVLVSAGSGVETVESARAAGATLLLHCQVGVEKQSIHITGDLTPLRLPFWDRLADPVPRSTKEHLFVSFKVDNEIRLLLGKTRTPPPLGSWHLKELLYVPRRVLDAGLGNLDGEKGSELVLLYEDAIEVYTFRSGIPKRLVTHSLARIAEAPVRVRDPTGVLLVTDFNKDGQHEVFYRLFNRRVGEILTWTGSDLRTLRELDKVPLCVYRSLRRAKVIYGAIDPGTNRYTPRLEVVDINQSSGKAVELPSMFSALRCWQPGNDATPTVVAVDVNGQLLQMARDGEYRPGLSGAGAGIGVLDLDRDDVPELVLSDPVWPGEPDGVRVISKGDIVWQSREVVGSIVSIAGGDLDSDGTIQALLTAVESGESASRIYLLGR